MGILLADVNVSKSRWSHLDLCSCCPFCLCEPCVHNCGPYVMTWKKKDSGFCSTPAKILYHGWLWTAPLSVGSIERWINCLHGTDTPANFHYKKKKSNKKNSWDNNWWMTSRCALERFCINTVWFPSARTKKKKKKKRSAPHVSIELAHNCNIIIRRWITDKRPKQLVAPICCSGVGMRAS